MEKATAIICAFNEETTIENVIRTICGFSIIDEVIVVNDGSTDGTGKLLGQLKKELEITVIDYKENKGKGYAMAVGIESSTNGIIAFMDADLSNIQEKHFEQLILPLLSTEADMVLGQATETLIDHSINPFKSFSGQRALFKIDVAPLLGKMKISRFGIETLLNLYYQSQGTIVKYVLLEGLEHPTKFDKTSHFQATKEFIIEGQEIATTAIKNYDMIIDSIKEITKKHI